MASRKMVVELSEAMNKAIIAKQEQIEKEKGSKVTKPVATIILVEELLAERAKAKREKRTKSNS